MKEQDLVWLKARLEEIRTMGWLENRRPGNIGGVGNTLEDLLGIAENSRPLPDFGAWEIKSQRTNTSSLLTLFHMEPRPQNSSVVSLHLLPNYGWPHASAGIKYPADERSFRQTLSACMFSERGFTAVINYDLQRILITFDYYRIDDRHKEWREFVYRGVGRGNLEPVPYWTFADIEQKLQKKLGNLLYVQADRMERRGREYFRYRRFEAYSRPTLERFLRLLEKGDIYIDFDARTGHNHGTKFRIRQSAKQYLYEQHITV